MRNRLKDNYFLKILYFDNFKCHLFTFTFQISIIFKIVDKLTYPPRIWTLANLWHSAIWKRIPLIPFIQSLLLSPIATHFDTFLKNLVVPIHKALKIPAELSVRRSHPCIFLFWSVAFQICMHMYFSQQAQQLKWTFL